MFEFLKEIKETKINHHQGILFKDSSKEKICSVFPELENIINSLHQQMIPKQFLTIDFSIQEFSKGEKSCVNPGWHVDGENNQYIILSWGDYLTQFLKKELPLVGSLKENNLIIKTLEKSFLIDDVFEIESGVPILYDSKQVHKGRIADTYGKRVFLRLCSSDYLNPKNFVRKIK